MTTTGDDKGSPLLDGEAADRQLYRCASPDPVIAEQGLLELAYAVDRAQAYLRAGVATMRRTGRTWKAIGDALGITAKEAENRYGATSNVTELRPRNHQSGAAGPNWSP